MHSLEAIKNYIYIWELIKVILNFYKYLLVLLYIISI